METWGDLPKDQTTPDTIDTEIDAKIQDHKDDPDAHLEVGQALQSHKASEIIDHLASSIIEDKIKDFEVPNQKIQFAKRQIWPQFESLDAWEHDGVGGWTLALGSLILSATNAVNGYSLARPNDNQEPINLINGNPTFEIFCYWYNLTLMTSHIGAGDPDIGFIGFKIVNGAVYACYVDDNGEVTQNLSFSDTGNKHTYRVTITETSHISFYIDNVLFYETNHTFSITGGDVLSFYLRVDSTSATTRQLHINDVRYFEDK